MKSFLRSQKKVDEHGRTSSDHLSSLFSFTGALRTMIESIEMEMESLNESTEEEEEGIVRRTNEGTLF